MTQETAKNILKEMHDKAIFSERTALEVFFPEFKDDEVERIRKSLLNEFTHLQSKGYKFAGLESKDIITWLEKQGEEKSQSDSKKLSEQIKDFEWEFGCWNSAQDFRPKHLQRCLCYDKYMKGVYCYVYDDISKYWCTQTTEEHNPDGDNHICDYADYRVTVWMSLPDTSFYPSKTLLDKQGEQNLVDKVEQKFKVGDWIITKDKNVHKDYSVCKIVEIENNRYYHLENGDYLDIDTLEQYDYRLWTIQDAKDGDVLQLGKVTAIFKKYIGDGNCKCYCSVYDGEFEIPNTDNSYGCHNAVPATKEQRELLFKKMAENGYAWDSEKKELKLVITNGGDFEPELSHKEVTNKEVTNKEVTNKSEHDGKKWIDEKVYWKEREELFEDGKQEVINNPMKYGLIKVENHIANDSKKVEPKMWSEEDDREVKRIIGLLEGWLSTFKETCYAEDCKCGVVWLKSIKERVHPKLQWTDEDERKRDLVYNALNYTYDIRQSAVLSKWLNRKLKTTEE